MCHFFSHTTKHSLTHCSQVQPLPPRNVRPCSQQTFLDVWIYVFLTVLIFLNLIIERHRNSTHSSIWSNGVRLPRTTVYYQGQIRQNKTETNDSSLKTAAERRDESKTIGDTKVSIDRPEYCRGFERKHFSEIYAKFLL